MPSFFDFESTYIELRMASVVGTQLMVWARTPVLGTWDLLGLVFIHSSRHLYGPGKFGNEVEYMGHCC